MKERSLLKILPATVAVICLIAADVYASGSFSVSFSGGTTDYVSGIPDNDTVTDASVYHVPAVIPERTGYEFLGWEVSTPSSGVQTDAVQYASYTVLYQDETGAQICDNKYVDSIPTDSYVTELAPAIQGYAVSGDDRQTLFVTANDDGNIITFSYIQTETTYSVFYLDSETGESVANVKTVNGASVGSSVQESAIEVTGCDLVSDSSMIIESLNKDSSQNNITFYYQHRKASYTVHYKDRSGAAIYPSKTVDDVDVGSVIEEYAVPIGDYSYQKEPIVIEISDNGSANIITFYYDPVG